MTRSSTPGEGRPLRLVEMPEWSASVERAVEAVKEMGGCGAVSPNQERICIREAGHGTICNWDRGDHE